MTSCAWTTVGLGNLSNVISLLCPVPGSLVVAAVRACKSARSTKSKLKCVRFVVHCVTGGRDAEGSSSEDEE